METGVLGADGALALKHANKENNQEHVNVIIQLPYMEEKNVMARQMKHKFVTTMYPVQVSWI